MNNWTSGYVADVGYTFGYYHELNPQRVPFTLLTSSFAPPKLYSCCELGFGQGLSVNIHAAASESQWFGTDFNPSQALHAQSLAHASGAFCNLFDQAFEAFCSRPDLPDFDYIGLHGIWSWISDQNRSVIVDFIARRLKVGGVLYISYNTLPGWASFAPMRHLMTEHAEVLGAEGRGIVSRIDGALEFAQKVLDTNPLFLRANPLVAERLSKLKEQSRHYLAHEYFNRDWHPMYFATMAEWMAPAKLHYACSAVPTDEIDAIHLSAEQQKLLAEIPDRMLAQTVRDFMTNQQFRRDYWIKGARKLSPYEQGQSLRALRFILITPKNEVSLKVTGALGEAALNENVYLPVLEALDGHHVKTMAELETLAAKSNVSFPQLLQALNVLVATGHVCPVQTQEHIEGAGRTAKALNSKLKELAKGSGDINYLASPVTGGGIIVSRFAQLFLSAIDAGCAAPEEWAQYAWNLLKQQGQRIMKEGKALESEAENIAELCAQAREFQTNKLPVLQALQAV